MKKLLGIIILGLLLSGNVYAETEKELKNKIGILEDTNENLIALNKGQKGEQKNRCNRPPLKNINFNVVMTEDGKKWGCLSGDCTNGEGEFRDSQDFYYIGNFKFGRLDGEGVIKTRVFSSTGKRTIITGNFINGCAQGKGQIQSYKGKTYNGSFIDFKFSPEK
jgi:hypothetical protein